MKGWINIMYFLDDTHKTYYEHLTTMIFKGAKNDPEYHALAYILSTPHIYQHCIKDKMLSEYPFLWTAKYEDTSYYDKEEDGENYLVFDFEVERDSEGKEINSDAFNKLSSGYKKLVDLAANVFNSSNKEFNLQSALGTWDDHLFKVYQQAVFLRVNRRIEGLTVSIK